MHNIVIYDCHVNKKKLTWQNKMLNQVNCTRITDLVAVSCPRFIFGISCSLIYYFDFSFIYTGVCTDYSNKTCTCLLYNIRKHTHTHTRDDEKRMRGTNGTFNRQRFECVQTWKTSVKREGKKRRMNEHKRVENLMFE